jgi:RNA polymerase primary sigma factor
VTRSSSPGFTRSIGATLDGATDYTLAMERLLVCAARAGDPAARERLVERFTPRIGSVARSYRASRGIDRAELMQEGVAGLLTALERYDPDMGTPFWAYASWWVRLAMQQLVAEMTRPLVLSDRALRGLARIRDARAAHAREHGGEASAAQLVEATGLTQEKIERLLACERTARSLDEPVNGEEESLATLVDFVTDPSAEDSYSRVDQGAQTDDVLRLMVGLDERERRILEAHYGLGGRPQTLREIAAGLSLSVERVRQIEERALSELREALGRSGTPAPALAGTRAFRPHGDPTAFRSLLARELRAERLPRNRATDMVLAAHELAVDARRHGARVEELRVGRVGDGCVCDIVERGGERNGDHSPGRLLAERLVSRIEEFSAADRHTFRVWV